MQMQINRFSFDAASIIKQLNSEKEAQQAQLEEKRRAMGIGLISPVSRAESRETSPTVAVNPLHR